MQVIKNNITKSVLKLAVPSVLEQILFMVVGVVSTILVGRLSNEAISAVGLINTLFGFIMVVFVALSTGSTVLIARLIGEGNAEKAKDAVRQAVVLGSLMSFVISASCYILAAPILNTLFSSAAESVKDAAILYFKITLYTYPLALINILISGGLRGAGDTKTPMIIASIVNILNIILGIVLIFGFRTDLITIEGMGVSGFCHI